MAYQGKSLYIDFQNLPLTAERFTLEKIIARGNYSQIYQAIDHQNDHIKVAVKIIENISDQIDDIEEEYRILKDLSRNAHLPIFYGIFLRKFDQCERDQLWIVMEYCSAGSVIDLVRSLRKKDLKLPETLIAFVIKEMIETLSYLHMNHILHRDIKGRHILLTGQGSIKLVDFGYSKHLKHTMSRRLTSIGSPYWMAPEVIQSQERGGYDNHSDVWSLGITAIELADGQPPLSHVHPIRALFQIVRNPPPTFQKPSEWSTTFNDFISECLVKNPEHRPVIMELADHPFIQEVPENADMLRSQLKDLIERHLVDENDVLAAEITVRNGNYKDDRVLPWKRIYPDDLANQEATDDTNIIDSLHQRYLRGDFHTYVGNILFVLNPQQEMNIYNEQHHSRYKCKARPDEAPHIYAIVDRAWQDMLHHKEHQNIVLTGDKNSGKTFNFNQIVDHFCYIATGNKSMAEKIQQLPFILDSFGNAATVDNVNSTKHVRYLELTFTETGKLSGAIISLYLLDKWRISGSISKDNRNFHIFYDVYYGLRQEGQLEKYHLDGIPQFRYLHLDETMASSCASRYTTLMTYLQIWNLEEDEVQFLLNTLSAVLLIGQIAWTGTDSASVENPDLLSKVAKLLNVPCDKLEWALTKYKDFSHGEEFNPSVQSYSLEEANKTRDSLSRGLYSRLVDWVVNTLNIRLCSGRLIFGDYHTIGILDPFGFQNSDNNNSLEELISNLTHEQLLYHYNQRVFSWEMQDYQAEGIEMPEFHFHDNRPILDLILCKPDGLLSFLDDECRSSGDPVQLKETLKRRLNSDLLTVNDDLSITIQHQRQSVAYSLVDFIDKNRDYLAPELIEVMRLSENQHLSQLFTFKMTKTGHVTTEMVTLKTPKEEKPMNTKRFNTISKGKYSQTRQMQTLSMQLRHSLIELLQKLVKGTPHFVCCIRPNDNYSRLFQHPLIQQQIRLFSISQTIEIRQQGFSYRVPLNEFLRRYKFLAFDFDENVEITGDNCRLLLLRLKMEGWILGKSKIFLKYYNEEYLSRLYEIQMKKIVKIQSVMRVFLQKREKNNDARSKIQNQVKKMVAMSLDEAAIAIQRNFRGYQVRKEYGPISKRERFQSATVEEEAANIIQYYWRKWKAKTLFQQLLLFRAEKQQQLIYFCQQVHLYNQEYCGYVRQTANGVDRDKIEIREKKPLNSSLGIKVQAKKIPLLMKNRHFLDTTFMCATALSRIGKNKSENSSDGDRPQENSESNEITTEKVSSIKTSAILSPNGRSPGSKVKFQVGEWDERKPVPLSAKPVKVASPGKNYDKKTGQKEVNQEMQEKSKGMEHTQSDPDEAPFNFQSMLRKTNYCRESMRRQRGASSPSTSNTSSDEKEELPQKTVLKSPRKSSFSKNAKNDSNSIECNMSNTDGLQTTITSPTKYEIVPGVFVEGQEAEL